MRWIWSKKKLQQQVAEHQEQSSIEVQQLKGKTGRSTAEAHKATKQLNDLLKANGITLKIHIATTGGHKHAR